MPVEQRTAVVDFDEHGTALVTAKVKNWWVLKESLKFAYEISQMSGPSRVADLAYNIVATKFDEALRTSSVPSLARETELNPEEDISVSMPNILFLAVFSTLDKVAFWAETEATEANVEGEDKASSILDGAGHVLNAYRAFQPQAAEITQTYAVA